jgi:hypothetical protein
MKILLIGGKGFLGTHLLNALCLADPGGFEVSIGSRTGSGKAVAINLGQSADFPRLLGFDAVVNCAAIPPEGYEPLIRYCLTSGVRLLDTTADPETIRVLMDLKRTLREGEGSGMGLFLFGIGVFPGVSNLLIKQELMTAVDAKSALLGIRYNVSSGAGRGMCRMMVETIGSPCRWYHEGQEKQSAAPFHSLERLPFGNRLRPAMQVRLAELDTIHALLPEGSARCFISFGPTAFNWPSYHLFNWVAHSGRLKKGILRLLYNLFYLVRGKVMRTARTQIRLLCRLVDNNGGSSDKELWLNDAMLAAGLFNAALLRLVEEAPDLRGYYSTEDLWDLRTILPLMAKLGRNTLQYA